MTKKPETKTLETVRGSGNVFADLGLDNANIEQAKAVLAAEIIAILDGEGLSVRAAQERTGVTYTDFSRIRNLDLDRFTIDRLMKILGRFNRNVRLEVSVSKQELETA
jgi:predicted XRE-type DNA-binding protein